MAGLFITFGIIGMVLSGGCVIDLSNDPVSEGVSIMMTIGRVVFGMSVVLVLIGIWMKEMR